MPTANETIASALSLIERVWHELCADGLAWAVGKLPDRLPDLSFDAAVRRARLGEELLRKIDAVDSANLPGEIALTLAIARVRAESLARSERWYWLVIDIAFPVMFLPTAYGAGMMLGSYKPIFAGHALRSPADRHRYLALVHDYARLVRQVDERTRGQAERGIVMPKAQLPGSIALMRQLRDTVAADLAVVAERLPADAQDFANDVKAAIDSAVLPAFDDLMAAIEAPDYAAQAPETVGLGQYPGGREIYAELVMLHTTLDLTPEQVHARGHERMREVNDAMRTLLDRVGFEGTPHEYLAAMASDPAWRAETPEAIATFFQKYIDRIAPRIDENFRFKPKAGHGVQALPAALSGSMTFGYYSIPSPAQPDGLYLFNAVNLAQAPLPNVAALNYHELVPGHHTHVASQRENEGLHPLRQNTLFGAFNEGWAEYAATLAGEFGMYEEPEEQFGRLMMDAFLTTRLVVDTGMNAFGWSLEQARDYMRANGFMPEREVQSETLRYSCGIPAQALAYKLGDDFLFAERGRMQAALGKEFDLRDFHDAVLKPGGLPFPLVARNIDAAIAEAESPACPKPGLKALDALRR